MLCICCAPCWQLDVEGFELFALRGMRTLLTTSPPPAWLFIEFFPMMLRAAGIEPTEVLRWLGGAGYACEAKGGPVVHDVESREASVRSIGPRVHLDLICRPQNRPQLARSSADSACRCIKKVVLNWSCEVTTSVSADASVSCTTAS